MCVGLCVGCVSCCVVGCVSCCVVGWLIMLCLRVCCVWVCVCVGWLCKLLCCWLVDDVVLCLCVCVCEFVECAYV